MRLLLLAVLLAGCAADDLPLPPPPAPIDPALLAPCIKPPPAPHPPRTVAVVAAWSTQLQLAREDCSRRHEALVAAVKENKGD